jgi:hypothetical protein
MQFLIQRGHSRLVPPGGLAEFPDAILNAKRLDLYNLYKEVIIHTFFLGETRRLKNYTYYWLVS